MLLKQVLLLSTFTIHHAEAKNLCTCRRGSHRRKMFSKLSGDFSEKQLQDECEIVNIRAHGITGIQ